MDQNDSKWIEMDQMSTKHNGHDFRTTYFQLKFALLIVLALAYFQPVSQIMERLRSHICISEGQIFSL